jgi:hypothetical protein
MAVTVQVTANTINVLMAQGAIHFSQWKLEISKSLNRIEKTIYKQITRISK